MILKDSLSELASDDARHRGDIIERCESANFRWDKAVSDSRTEEYYSYIGQVFSHKDWRAEHRDFINTFVQIPHDFPRSSESFMAVNAQAHLSEDLDDTFLLRLESLGHIIAHPLAGGIATDFWARFYNSQQDLIKPNLSPAAEQLRSEFVMQWNELRTQARPLFATFLNEFGGNLKQLAKQDWPHLLRNRLGLTHWAGIPGNPLPVALMCYSLSEVRESRLLASKKGAVASFSRPTVLDAEMSSAFIPAPLLEGGESYGYTLDLSVQNQTPATFTPELLNFPLAYQPRHIIALGFITEPHNLTSDNALLDARNYHVKGLKSLPDCHDYGEELL